MRISDWSSDVCSSDLEGAPGREGARRRLPLRQPAVRQRDPGEALGHLGDEAQADQRSPVLAREDHVPKVERLDPRTHPRNLARIAVSPTGRATCRERVCKYE